MSQFQIPISMAGGFSALADAKAHHNVIGKLKESVDLAASTSADLRQADKVDVGKVSSDLYQDLAPGQGHVVMLSQPEGRPLQGAELNYNPADGAVRSMIIDLGDSKLSQAGHTYKLEDHGVTTYFQQDEKRGVFTVLDADSEVPRIFAGADPRKLMGGTIQIEQPFIIF